MANSVAETLIGAVVLIAAGGFFAYAAQMSDRGGGAGTYALTAKFRKADGLSPGSDVRMSGVKVGSITGLSLDRQTYEAVVSLRIADDITIPDDSDAKIETESILGGNYVAITPGASDAMLAPGAQIVQTQGSVSLLDLLLKFGTSATTP